MSSPEMQFHPSPMDQQQVNMQRKLMVSFSPPLNESSDDIQKQESIEDEASEQNDFAEQQ